MYKILNKEKIVGVADNWSDTDKKFHPDLVAEEDTEHSVSDYTMLGEEYVLSTDERAIEKHNQERIAELEKYLKDTDWYAIRFADTQEEYSAEIKKARQDARDEISRLRDENE